MISSERSMISNYESILKYLINFTEKMILWNFPRFLNEFFDTAAWMMENPINEVEKS